MAARRTSLFSGAWTHRISTILDMKFGYTALKVKAKKKKVKVARGAARDDQDMKEDGKRSIRAELKC